MNTHKTLEFVRNLCSTNLKINSVVGLVGSGPGYRDYIVMAAAPEGVLYRRAVVSIVQYNAVWLSNDMAQNERYLGGRYNRVLQYGLGSWCYMDGEIHGMQKCMLWVSTRLWNRELNQGTY